MKNEIPKPSPESADELAAAIQTFAYDSGLLSHADGPEVEDARAELDKQIHRELSDPNEGN